MFSPQHVTLATSVANTHTESYKCDQTHFSVANFYLDDL